MNREKQTFVDPQTGEEMESTRLARMGVGWVGGVVGGVTGGMMGGVFGAALGEERLAMLLLGLVGGLFLGSLTGLGYGLKFGLGSWSRGLEEVREPPLDRRIHDGIARRQHTRRQRLLRRGEYPHVPAGALSRARRVRDPEPTQTALSRTASPPGEKARLTREVEENTKEEIPVRKSAGYRDRAS